jgi:CRP/FNR family nitrogen fixation transcriptional regulator
MLQHQASSSIPASRVVAFPSLSHARTRAPARPETSERPAASPLDVLGVTRAVAKSEMIFAEGEPATRRFKVVGGAIRCFKVTLDGRRQITRFCLPGDVFGWSSHKPYACSTEAITDGVVRCYQTAEVDALMATNAQFRRIVMDDLREEYDRAQEHMLMLGRMSALERVAAFLLMLRERTCGNKPSETAIRIPMSREDIGDYLGLTIESVSRTFSELRRRGVIALEPQHCVTLVRAEALRDLAGSYPS